MKKPTLKDSLGAQLGETKKIEKQELNIPAIKENVSEIHKPQNKKIETKGIFIKIDKDLHKSIKNYCVLNEFDMQGYFIEAIILKAKNDKLI